MTPPRIKWLPYIFLIITIIMITDACNNNEHIPTRVTIIYSLLHNLYKTSHPAVHLPCSHMKGETNGRNHHKPPCHQKCLGAHKCNWFQSGYSAAWLDTVFSGGASGKGVSSWRSEQFTRLTQCKHHRLLNLKQVKYLPSNPIPSPCHDGHTFPHTYHYRSVQ